MTTHLYPFDARAEVAPFVPRDVRRLLDVGCSSGGFGNHLRQTRPDLELVGVEAHPEAAEQALPWYDDVIQGTFPDAVAGRSLHMDCVVFNDVLEHMGDPWSTLRSTHDLLSPGGVVVASIPNVRGMQVLIDLVVRGDWHYREMGTLDRTHLRFFTKRSMRRLFEETGYDVERIEGIFPLGSRWHIHRATTLLLRDIAYLEFVVVAKPKRRT